MTTLRPAQQRATIGDVARAAGVSKGTVSLAYSGKRPVSADTRRRILEAAETLRWTPSHRARALATSRSGAIGLVLARQADVIATDSFFPRFIAGLESVLADHDMGLMLNVAPHRDAERATYERFAAGRADAAVILDVEHDDWRFDLVRSLDLPAVALTDGAAGAALPGIPCVHSDDSSAIREIVELLVGLGHERIAHVAGPSRYVHGTTRREAFASSMSEHGLDPSLVVESDFSAASGRELTAQLLSAQQRPTAIVYANDVMAIAGLSFARSIGLRVPKDLSITGFDDHDLSAQLSPGLTSVSTSAFERGCAVAETVLAELDGRAPGSVLVEGTRLIVRGSTTSPPSASPPNAASAASPL